MLSGLYDNAKIAAICGLVSGCLITADRVWPTGEKAQFFRELVAEARNLEIDIPSIGDDRAKYDKAAEIFKVLQLNAAKQIPRGEGITAIKEFANELNAAKK